MSKKIVGIHQPNLFPWLGYFRKIYRSDTFVLLDDVQFQKAGRGNWCNRAGILNNGERKWLTLSVDRKFSGVKLINEMGFAEGVNWKSDILNKLASYYKKSEYFDETFELVSQTMSAEHKSIAEFNMRFIEKLCVTWSFKTELVRSSSLNVQSASTQRLIDITKNLGGNEYLSGNGAEDYQEISAFEQNGISVSFVSLEYDSYPQVNTDSYVSGLSVLDALFNVGFESTLNLIKSGK